MWSLHNVRLITLLQEHNHSRSRGPLVEYVEQKKQQLVPTPHRAEREPAGNPMVSTMFHEDHKSMWRYALIVSFEIGSEPDFVLIRPDRVWSSADITGTLRARDSHEQPASWVIT